MDAWFFDVKIVAGQSTPYGQSHGDTWILDTKKVAP